MPAGARVLPYRSNIPAMAAFAFDAIDETYSERARERGDHIVVAGWNYGQGSSREQAAFAALHLGIRAIVAKSFARIHRTNLIAQGILPLVLVEEADHDQVEQGQDWRIPVELGREVEAETPFGPVRLDPRLTARECAVLRAGGLIAYCKA
jgi:aconitate hydratase